MPRIDYRDESRRRYGNDSPTGNATFEQLNCGSLMRIADAAEQMAKNYVALQAERDRYERWYQEERERRQHIERRVVSLRGVITRLKRGRKG